MKRSMARFALLAVAALLIPLSSQRAVAEQSFTPADPVWLAGLRTVQPKITCTVWIGTDYFTDASHATRVGVCTITCSQFDLVEPTFSGGGTCSGSSSSFTLRRFFACPGPCR